MWHFVSEYLLIHSDKLELKNFGSFSAKTLPSYIDEKTHKASPAKRIFEFRSTAEETSEKFIEFIAGKLNKTEEQAQNYIEEEIKKSLKELEKQNKIELPLIGYIQLTNKHPRLVQTATYSLHPDNFGFTDILIPNSNEQAKTKTFSATTQTSKKQKDTSSTDKKQNKKQKTSKITDTKRQQSTSKKKKTSKSVFIVLGAVVILALVAFIIKTNLGNNFQPNKAKQTEKISRQKQTNTPQQVVNVNKQNNNTNTSQQKNNATEQNADSQAQQNQLPRQVTQQNTTELLSQVQIKAHIYLGPDYKKYYLIVGSFRELENARKFKNMLISAGYTNAGILTNDPNKKRVYIDAFNDINKAVEAYKQYKNRYPKRGIWLLINSNNGN